MQEGQQLLPDHNPGTVQVAKRNKPPGLSLTNCIEAVMPQYIEASQAFQQYVQKLQRRNRPKLLKMAVPA